MILTGEWKSFVLTFTIKTWVFVRLYNFILFDVKFLYCNFSSVTILFFSNYMFKHIIYFFFSVLSFLERVVPSTNPCVPTPCGPNSQCRVVDSHAACSCLPNYVGRSPNCRPECTINAECASHLACQNERCRDPCPGSCGSLAICRVVNHSPVCTCPSGYTGDPFSGCSLAPSKIHFILYIRWRHTLKTPVHVFFFNCNHQKIIHIYFHRYHALCLASVYILISLQWLYSLLSLSNIFSAFLYHYVYVI